ncbi:CDP-diacylglycerol--glycerol-3-phosphate 3-phosphatidyltransferase [Oscillospiraceae bacterium HV4-5-C5C]|nr:CDP-diacylglycerol--glycerol-3-phosphate 3-phosphatidyltransferase [Oscillospiraceae bacterium HV4-5-C5C]
MNLPNKLTVMRIILIPLVLIFLLPLPWSQVAPWNDFLLNGGRLIALLFFMIASYTDYLDGHIARSRGIVTNLGKFLDPIADKMLVLSVFIALTELGRISSWIPVIILFRELSVTGIRLLAAKDGVVIAASKLGKLKTVTQMIALILLLLDVSLQTLLPASVFLTGLNLLGNIALLVCIITTFVSGYDYLKKNQKLLR